MKMDTELIVKTLVYIHAVAGGVGLITGLGALLVRKGDKQHKVFGKIFNYGMGISALLSLIIARMPHHENTFLFLIGIFTIYMLSIGTRSLRFKQIDQITHIWIDKVISSIMLMAAICMIVFGYILFKQKNGGYILYVFFGLLGGLMSIKDLRFYRNQDLWKKKWITNHIGKMVGAYIASVTAFLVAGLRLSTVSIWITPTIIGTIYIIYWVRKMSPSKKKLA